MTKNRRKFFDVSKYISQDRYVELRSSTPKELVQRLGIGIRQASVLIKKGVATYPVITKIRRLNVGERTEKTAVKHMAQNNAREFEALCRFVQATTEALTVMKTRTKDIDIKSLDKLILMLPPGNSIQVIRCVMQVLTTVLKKIRAQYSNSEDVFGEDIQKVDAILKE